MLRVSIAFAAIAAAAVAQASNAHCLAPEDCSFYWKHGGGVYSWDLSPLCQSADYATTDGHGHAYSFQVCGTAQAVCYPPWKPSANSGGAVQSWGPTSRGPCYTAGGKVVNCTASCEVLGIPKVAHWAPVVNASGHVVGVTQALTSPPSSDDDPNFCDLDPKTGEQHQRSVSITLLCDTAEPGLKVVNVTQAATDDCAYSIFARSAYGCARLGGAPPQW